MLPKSSSKENLQTFPGHLHLHLQKLLGRHE
jgi:hypothetical protein